MNELLVIVENNTRGDYQWSILQTLGSESRNNHALDGEASVYQQR